MVASYDPEASIWSSSWRHVTPLVWPFSVLIEHRPYFQLYPIFPYGELQPQIMRTQGYSGVLTCQRSL